MPNNGGLGGVSKRRRWLLVAALILVVIIVSMISIVVWYRFQLNPANPTDKTYQSITVAENSNINTLAHQLNKAGIIKNAFAFEVYAKLNGKATKLVAGQCSVAPSQTVDEILNAFTGGCQKTSYESITFFPGATIEKPLFKSVHADNIDQDQMYIKGILSRAGYSSNEIDTALKATYSGQLFSDKPAGTSLEGYIFGETYYIDPDASAETVLQTTFDEMYKQISANNIQAGFVKQGLNLYEGITLSSIVQRELNCEGKTTDAARESCYENLRGVAGVFLNRLNKGIMLGSDVTFIYAADKLGVTPTVNIDSKYNTRRYTGLPPGPIASPGVLAMKAVADPAESDNLYFIAGDDGNIYFATDEAGHQRNIAKYCQKLCSEL